MRATVAALMALAMCSGGIFPGVAVAEEATGYSVGTPVESSGVDDGEGPHEYAYPSRSTDIGGLPVEMREEDVSGMQVLVLSSSFDGDLSGKRKVLFVHGGAFVSQLTTDHIWLASYIAKATGAVVYLPSYPVADDHTDYRDTYPPMFDLYRRISEQTNPEDFFVFGDSAGAGLAMGLCQLVSQTDGMRQPANLILVSPWANVSEQPWDGLGDAADAWSGGDSSQHDWQVSPVYGQMRGLSRVTIYNGEKDGLSDSIEKLYRQLRGNNIDCQLIEEHDAIHDYPYLLPRPEAIRAFNLICSSIAGRVSPQDNDMTWDETLPESRSYDNGHRDAAKVPKSVGKSPAYEGVG